MTAQNWNPKVKAIMDEALKTPPKWSRPDDDTPGDWLRYVVMRKSGKPHPPGKPSQG